MRPILCAAALAALTFAISSPTKSQTSSHPLTAADAVLEALAENRDLQAARSTIDVTTALTVAASKGHTDMVKLLKRNGAKE